MMKKPSKYVQRIVDINRNTHENSIKLGTYEVYIYNDTVHVTKDGVILCKVYNGRLVCGGINILAIRGPSDEFFACVWVYSTVNNKLEDLMGVIAVDENYDAKITQEHEIVLNEILAEIKEDFV